MNASPNPILSADPVNPPRQLPLHAWHLAHGARMESFAGWSMPIHYALGVLGEHRHTRTAAGLFDVSHMGQIMVRSRVGDQLAAARALEAIVPVDVLGLPPGRQRYAFLTTGSGAILDDLMFANLGEAWYLVVNAASAVSDLAYLRTHLGSDCSVEPVPGRTLLAVQGPQACDALASLVPAVSAMRFMDAAALAVDGSDWYVSRSGYTGEDGFEISLPAGLAEAVADRLLRHSGVLPIGLGARDSLRLEAGLCLCGHDIGESTTPVEAALGWAIQPARRTGGARAGGFPGADVILRQLDQGAPRKRVGLRAEGRPVREGAPLFVDAAADGAPVGRITSGTFGPSTGCPIAMGYVPTPLAAIGTRLAADVRGQRIPVTVSELPFVPHRYRH